MSTGVAERQTIWVHCPSCAKLLGRYEPALDRIVVTSGRDELRCLPGSERRCRGCGAFVALERPG